MFDPPRAPQALLHCLVAVLGLASTPPLAETPRPALVIDTDAALDALRAIALLASDPAVDLAAVVLTNPVRGPQKASTDVKRILDAAGRDGLPVVVDAEKELDRALGSSRDSLTWVALAPLTTLATWLEGDAGRRSRLTSLRWSGGLPYDDRPGQNIERDILASRKLFESGIQIRAIALFERERLHYDAELHAALEASDAPLARALVEAHGGKAAEELIVRGQLEMLDDAVARRAVPARGTLLLVEGGRKGRTSAVVEKWNEAAARRAFIDRITGG